MSQAALEWLEDEETQRRITGLREAIDDLTNAHGLIIIFDTQDQFLEWAREAYCISPTQEDIDFVGLEKYFPEKE